MNIAAENLRTEPDIAALMQGMGKAARAAAVTLATASTDSKNSALREAANSIRARTAEILSANAKDMTAATAKGLSSALLDRLELNDERIDGMAAGLETIAALDDPVGRVLAGWEDRKSVV